MWFLLGVFTAVAVWWLFPFALFAARRLLLSLRLQRWARRHGAVFQPLKPFWFFDSIRSARCACMIETADTRYVLKLGGGISKRLLYHFIDPTHYAVRSLRFEWLASNVRFDAYKRKAKEPYRFADHSDPSGKKECRPILLWCPASLCVSRQTEERGKTAMPYWFRPSDTTDAPRDGGILQSGDFTGEAYFYEWNAFKTLL